MSAVRAIEVEVGGNEDAATTFARDQWMMLRTADDGVARARVWRRSHDGLLLGRFHRADPAFLASAAAGGIVDDDVATIAGSVTARRAGNTPAGSVGERAANRSGGLSRRLSGGRIVPAGPGVVCITLAAPVVDWLDPAGKALRPEQILNRAVRPLLALLRGDGIDAFYPGRDLVTVASRTIAHVSFTVMRDGVAVIEMHIAEAPVFAELPSLLDRFDPAGIAGVDRAAMQGATSVEESGAAARGDDDWASRFAACAAKAFGCEVREIVESATHEIVASATQEVPASASHEPFEDDTWTEDAEGPRSERLLTLAHESAVRDFLAEPGPLAEGMLSAAAVSMLGVVECSARLRGDRVTGLSITGDLIAPFHTIDDIATECEGQPLRADYIRKALARATGRPRSFLLGLRDLDELILRLA